MRKRLYAICITLGVILLALIGRTAYIQLLGNEDLKEAAGMQQLITLEGANTRGLIYDRNNTPLIGNNKEYIYIIKAEHFQQKTQTWLDQVGAKEIRNSGSMYNVYRSKLYDKEIGKNLISESKAYIIEAGRRYSDAQTAIHILGYVNPRDTSGATGLELMYNDELSLLNKKVSTAADVKGNIVPGKGLIVSSDMEKDSYVKKGITTTLEAGLQKKVEEILYQEDKAAAAVVLNSKTGEILASASTPIFNPNKVDDYMDSKKNELFNKVTQGEYAPGSVFKIVVAAAALESGIKPEQTFHCRGYEVVNGKKVKCKTGGKTGHGKITFKDGFAQSCNSTFIQIGKKTGAANISKMAEAFALGEKTIEGYPQEKAGHVTTGKQASGAGIANLSIGQGEMLTTPLQVARMTNIVAQGGIDRGIGLILDREEQIEERVISEETAQMLNEMMEEVIRSGSGKALASDVPMAAKTGSAETSVNGKDVVHGWMTGFVPVKEPEYTITVFVEDGKSGSGSAGPIYKKIAEYLSESGNIEVPVGF